MPAQRKSYFRELAEIAHMPIVTARIDKLVNSPSTHIKAVATVNLGGAFVVHDVKVVDGKKGLFVQMPQTTFTKDGQVAYRDTFHAVTADAREEINGKVLQAFRQKLSEDASQTHAKPFPVLDDFDPDIPFDMEDAPPGPGMAL